MIRSNFATALFIIITLFTYPVFAKLAHNFVILTDVKYSGVPGFRFTFKISTRNRYGISSA